MTIEAEQTMAKLHNAHWLGTGYDILELDPLDAGSGKKQRLVEFKKWIDDRESGVSRPAGTRYGTGTAISSRSSPRNSTSRPVVRDGG
jgi:hypothetical protein